MTLQELAQSAYDRFESRERDNGESFVSLRDDAPEWLTDLVRDAHGDMLPDDWRYESIRSAVGFLADVTGDLVDDASEMAHEFADSNVDTYNGARLAWLSSNLTRAAYCDEAAAEFGDSAGDIFATIGLGQYRESTEVFLSVADSLRERCEELELETEESA